jgi:hypothetical protein
MLPYVICLSFGMFLISTKKHVLVPGMSRNYVKAVPMRSRSTSEWVKAYKHIHQELTSWGFTPKIQTLDNEDSMALKIFFTKNDMEYQLIPTHFHRRNAAELVIHAFKEHFVAGLASLDPDFPLHLWGHLLAQA